MGGGLGFGLLPVKPGEDKVLSSQRIEENKGDDLKQKAFDLNEEPIVSSLKDVEIEECREDDEVGNLKVGELNENDQKKGRVEDNVDNKKDDSVKKNLKEKGLEGKVQFSGRVLRSRFATKNGCENEGDKLQSGIDNTEDNNSCKKKTVEMVKGENDHSHGEAKEVQRKPGMKCSDRDEKKAVCVEKGQSKCSDGSKVGKMAKRKRGRPPKFQGNAQFEKSAVELQVEENDYPDGAVRKEPKRKRGRPPKVLGNCELEKNAVKIKEREIGHFDIDVSKESKRKRGRPPKVLGNSGFEKTVVKSDQSDGGATKKSKHKRGRPKKVHRNQGLKKKVDEVKARESYHSAVETREETSHKHGILPRMHGNDGFVMEMGEGDHFDCELRKEVSCKRGRPTMVRGSDGLVKKWVELKREGSGQNNSKVREGVIRKRGRPSKVQGSDGLLKKWVELKGEGSDQNNGKVREGVIRKRGRPPKVQGSDGPVKKWVELKRDGSDQNNSKVREGVIRKRGRPPKLQGGNKALMGKLINGKKRLGGLRRGRKKLRGSLKFNVPANTSYSEKRLIGKESNVKRFVSANKVRFDDVETNDSKASPILRPNFVNVEGKEKSVRKAGDEAERRRSAAKRAVKAQIVKLLKAAGWTIDYRPRNNRLYNDAVYVNPEGNTHWSVTKAYRALKKYYESGDCDPKVSPNGFIFTPIPEEELTILTRIIRKKRLGKKKPKRGDDDTVDDGEAEKKLNKRKKERKGNGDNEDVKKKKKQKLLKEKLLLHEEENSDGILQRGTQVSGRKRKLQQTQNRKQYALLVRNSMDAAESDNGGYVLYDGKRTVLAWMIDLGTVPQDGKVEYLIQRKTRTRESKSGRITRDGIRCNCCCDVFTVAEFETHAGSKLHRPFQNISLETGIPLLQCLLDAWNKQQESKCKSFHFVDFGGEDPNDDTCGICGDGGDLICCDSCPSTFHQSCLDIQAFPSGKWNCVYCTCKYCGVVGNTYRRDKEEDTDPTVVTCHLCEEKYHQPCIQQMDAFRGDSNGASFCGKRCKELFERLQTLVGVKHELPEGFSWTLLHRFDISSDACLSEAYLKVESNSKLAVALSVMDECFLPLVDHRSGVNLIHNIVYNFGSNFTRLNYSGFFTAILERGDEIISAASIRIHGNELAEMPFIGTRYTYRRQGMCRRLLCAVESALSSMNVEKLVIPAISELRETWISAFGFQPLETASKQKMRNMNMLVFPGVELLQKSLLTHVMADHIMGERSNKSGEKCSLAFDLNVSAESPAPQTDENNDESAAFESTTLLLDGTVKYTSDIMGETINIPESATVSCSSVLAPEERKLDFDSRLSISSEEKIDENILKQNLDSEHGGSVKHSDDTVGAENKVAVLVHVSKVAGKNVVTNGFDDIIQMSEDANDVKHRENSEFRVVECISGFDETEEVKNFHAIAKDVANRTSPSALSSGQDVANGGYDIASNDSKSTLS